MTSPPLAITAATEEARALCDALGCPVRIDVPDARAIEDVEAWDRTLTAWGDAARARHDPTAATVVAAVGLAAEPLPLVDHTPELWRDRFTFPLMLWFCALQVAVDLTGDGGAVVAAIDEPAPLDAAGWAGPTARAGALATAARSAALVAGRRRVRVSTVTTPVATHDPAVPLPGSAPALATYPGTVEREVAGAVRLLLAGDAAGLTGTRLRADGGRAW